MGSVDGPYSKSTTVSHRENAADKSSTESEVTTKASSSYPFKAVTPDIDYTLVFNFKRDPAGKTEVNCEITHNNFPYYELLLNGKDEWKFSSPDPGPGIWNLTHSTTSNAGPWYY